MTVIYIIGVGRSGSTVLGTVLGNHSQIESVGELINLPRSGWTKGEYCACGKPGDECHFWSAVRGEWVHLTQDDDVGSYIKLAGRFERFRQWPQLLSQRRHPSREFQEYAHRTLALFKAIQNVSRRPIIVDSSKHPVRGYALSLVPGINLCFVQLVRDARGVTYSRKIAYKKNYEQGLQKDIHQRPAGRTALLWVERNIQAAWVRKRVSPNNSIFTRYEDFMTDPPTITKRICHMVDLDAEPLIQKVLDNNYSFAIGHTIAGNRLRMAGDMKLRFDEAWRTNLTPRDRRTVEFLAGWLLRRYGYM